MVRQRDDHEVHGRVGAQRLDRVVRGVHAVRLAERGAAAARVEALATIRASGTKASPAA